MLAIVLARLGEHAAAQPLLRQGAAAAAAAGDTIGAAVAFAQESIALTWLGDADAAKNSARQAIELSNGVSPHNERMAYNGLGHAHLTAGELAEAHDAFAKEHDLAEAAHDGFSMATALQGLADTANAMGEFGDAREYAMEAVSLAEQYGFAPMEADVLRAWARAALGLGDIHQAETISHRAIAISQDLGEQRALVVPLELLAGVEAETDNPLDATRLLGAAESLRIATSQKPQGDKRNRQLKARLREALGDDFGRTWQEGTRMSPDDAVAYATRRRGERKRPHFGWQSLTPAERRVARLASEGLDNQQIAERLFISNRTVQSHLTHIYSKLGVSSRVRLANEAAKHPD